MGTVLTDPDPTMPLSKANRTRRLTRKCLKVEQQYASTVGRLNTLAETASRSHQDIILDIIESGRINANDTVLLEEAAQPEDWTTLFIGTIQALLDCNDYHEYVKQFFADNLK